MVLLLLFWEFFKTGLFAIGGGMATIPFLTQISARYPHWFSLPELADMIAVSESTPGPIGINMATYVGYIVAGIPGVFVATVSIILPSFIILLIIARVLQRFRSNRYVNAGFEGLRPAVTGLIAAAGYAVLRISVFKDGTLNPIALILFAAILLCTQLNKLKNMHPLAYIGISAVLGIMLSL